MGAGREVSAAGDEGEHSDVGGWSGLANKTAQNAPARTGRVFAEGKVVIVCRHLS